MILEMLRALVREEWIRVRLWWPFTVLALALYALALAALEPLFRHSSLPWAPRLDNGFEVWERTDGTPCELFIMFTILAGALIVGVLSAQQNARGLLMELPGRYLTGPARPSLIVMTQFVCRLVLLVPVAGLQYCVVRVMGLGSDYPVHVWLVGALVGAAGPLAATVWWHRIGWPSVWVWIIAPTGLWVVGTFDHLLSGYTPTVLHAAALAVGGLASACWLLSRGAALEAFTPPRLLGMPFSGGATTRRFSSAGAALRWSVRPHYLGWVLPLTALAALPTTVYIASVEFPLILGVNWLPWTPGYIKSLAIAQAMAVRWSQVGLNLLPLTLGLGAAFAGIQFLRVNVLRAPIHLRLPVRSGEIARGACVAVLGELARVAALGTILFLGVHMAASGPNIGTQYVWPEGSHWHAAALLDSSYGDFWQMAWERPQDATLLGYLEKAHGLRWEPPSILHELRAVGRPVLVFITVMVIAWTAFWQFLWALLPAWLESGLEAYFLIFIACWIAWRNAQQRRVLRSIGVLLVGVLIAVVFNAAMYGYISLDLGRFPLISRHWSTEHVVMTLLATLLVPVVSLQEITNWTRHR